MYSFSPLKAESRHVEHVVSLHQVREQLLDVYDIRERIDLQYSGAF